MSTPRFEIPRPGKSTALAAVFLDYENLHQLLSKHQKGGPHPDELILEMIDELRRTLQTDYQTEASILLAYADFGNLRGDGLYIQQSLYLHGVSPRFVASSFNKEAAEIQLSSDLTDLIHTRLDITTYVLVSGDRMHLPLIQKLKQYGRTALLVPLTHPPLAERTQVLQEALQIGGFDLLSESSRRCLYDLNSVSSNGNAAPPPRATPAAPRNVVHHEVTDDIAYETLRVIEEFFGQYDEVYLTPLLRKLSEVLNEEEPDPKSIINQLEEAGAVWLEKRRGYPYDYTVLLVDRDHPDVYQIQLEFRERTAAESSFRDEFDAESDFGSNYEGSYEDEGTVDEEDAFSDANRDLNRKG